MLLWVKTVAKNPATTIYNNPFATPTHPHLYSPMLEKKHWHLGELNLLTQQVRTKVAAILPSVLETFWALGADVRSSKCCLCENNKGLSHLTTIFQYCGSKESTVTFIKHTQMFT